MPTGKSEPQAGHAYVDALLLSLHSPDDQIRAQAEAYARLRPGTKVCLDGGSAERLDAIEARLSAAGLPVARIIDSGHVCPPDFDGSPILTALGVGPITRGQAPRILRSLNLYGKE